MGLSLYPCYQSGYTIFLLFNSLFQVFTVEFGGAKRVVISGFENFQEILEKNADYSSNRTTKTMPQNYADIARERPGLCKLRLNCSIKY